MKVRKLSIEYFKSNRIFKSESPEDRQEVLRWVKKLNKNENVPPIEVAYLTGAKYLSVIEGSERLKACEVTNQQFIFVKFINRSELTKNIFKQSFEKEHFLDKFVKKDKHAKQSRRS